MTPQSRGRSVPRMTGGRAPQAEEQNPDAPVPRMTGQSHAIRTLFIDASPYPS